MRPILSALLATAIATPALAAPAHPAAEAQALALAKELIAIRSVAGPGNKTGEADAAITRALTAAGWKPGEIETVPFRDTAYLIATWPGSDPSLKPLVISGHLDVVEAKPSDWQRDPFTPVVENGMLYGRGAIDMKFDAALATASLIELRREGYKPRRTVILQFSGDEETTMASSREIAKRLKNANIVINIDGGGGKYDEKTGKPLFWTWDGAEKFYNDYTLVVTNPGGHSSAPRPENAIVQLATALARIGAYHFKPELSPVTKGYFESASKFESDPAIAAAERAFAANPADEAAITTLRAHPETVGKIGTTCVPTMISGGHAENALPQRASANVNCRIFPGHSREEILAELQRVVGMDVVKITDATGENSAPSPASPLRPDFLAAVTRALHAARGNVPIFPTQASGASDSQWYRNLGVDSYGASPMFIKSSDEFAHGLNERAPVDNVAPGVTYFLSLYTDLSK